MLAHPGFAKKAVAQHKRGRLDNLATGLRELKQGCKMNGMTLLNKGKCSINALQKGNNV